MKNKLDGILLVEGKQDACYLSSYIASEIVVLNGFEISEKTLAYLKNKKVIALLDPDDAGEKIRKIINEKLDNVSNVFVDITKCNRGFKNGVAECEIDEILKQLSPFFVDKEEKTQNIVLPADLIEFNLLDNSDLRNKVCDKLCLGKCNGKQFVKRINSNNISLSAIKKVVEELQNGN